MTTLRLFLLMSSLVSSPSEILDRALVVISHMTCSSPAPACPALVWTPGTGEDGIAEATPPLMFTAAY